MKSNEEIFGLLISLIGLILGIALISSLFESIGNFALRDFIIIIIPFLFVLLILDKLLEFAK